MKKFMKRALTIVLYGMGMKPRKACWENVVRCEGPAEFTVRCGMYGETDTRTWEAPYIVLFSVFFTRPDAEYPETLKCHSCRNTDRDIS